MKILLNSRIIILCIAIALFFIPFFWFGSGEMDIGGDSSRLYFIDPLAYLLNHTLFSVSPSGFGGEASSFWGLPFLLVLYGLKSIVINPALLIKIIHGLTISLSFVFVYLSARELDSESENGKYNYFVFLAGIIAGLFYIFSPRLIIGWDRVILTFTQIYVNPLIFYLLLRYFKTNRFGFIITALIVTLIHSHNFSYAGAPPFFAFFPIAFTFLAFYQKIIIRSKLILKHFAIGIILFFGLHAFQLLPDLITIFTPGSIGGEAIFSTQGKYNRGLNYFLGVAEQVKVSTSIMGLPQLFKNNNIFSYFYIVFPFILLFGIFYPKKYIKEKKIIILSTLFFLLSFFLVTANITQIGFKLYSLLFNIPGFSMFRNYFGQWQYLFIFFYALVLSQCLVILFRVLGRKKSIIISLFLIGIIVLSAFEFITGNLTNKEFSLSKGTRVAINLDKSYPRFLQKIGSIPDEGKILSLPLADPGYQMIAGDNHGAYQGPSTIAYLAGKKDFVGFDDLGSFGNRIYAFVSEGRLDALHKVLSVMGISYIFHNSDVRIYDNFAGFPYDTVRNFLPHNQDAYTKLLDKLSIKEIYNESNKYHLYELNNSLKLPIIYAATNRVYANEPIDVLSSFGIQDAPRTVYLDDEKIEEGYLNVAVIKNVSPLLDIKNNYHLHIHDPFITHELDQVYYPFIIFREQQIQEKLKNIPDSYLDMNLLHIAKRVGEIKKFESSIKLLNKSWEGTNNFLGLEFGNYNSWESLLQRYKDQVVKVVEYINVSPDKTWRDLSLLKVNEQIARHQPSIKKVINKTNLSSTDKEYLNNLNNKIYLDLKNIINIKSYDNENITYQLDEGIKEGEYEIYLRDYDIQSDVESSRLTIGNRTIKPIGVDPKSHLVKFENVNISKSTPTLYQLYYPTQNSMAQQPEWLGSGTVGGSEENEVSITVTNDEALRQGVYARIEKWKPSTQYIITFDYLTNGKDFVYSLKERIQHLDGRKALDTYFEKSLNSSKWEKQQTIITSGSEGIEGYLYFSGNENSGSSKINVRNIQIKEVKNPQLIFKKALASKISSVPTIQFERVNPTKYIVRVTNSREPFMLVMLHAFNNKWKVFLDENNITHGKVKRNVASYFDGAVIEGSPSNIFFDQEAFETFGMREIAAKSHVLVNGYANGWTIDPQQVNNKTSYTLVVEMTSQRNFYIGLIVSVLTFIVVMGMSVRIATRRLFMRK